MITGDFFFLNPDCFLVTGAMNAALYSLDSGAVYAVDRPARLILESAMHGKPVVQIFQELADVEAQEEILAFLRKLEKAGLGRFTADSAPPPRIDLPEQKLSLEKVWLEVEEACNLRCVHCYAGSPDRSRCGSTALDPAAWRRVIAEAADLGARWLQLIGGEPLLSGNDKLFALILEARAARYPHIEVFTNGTLLSEEHIDFFAAHEVQTALSIYSRRAEIHDRITGRPGSFARVMESVTKLRERGVPVRFGLVIMDVNQADERETLDWLREDFADVHVAIDVIRGAPGLLTPELWRRRLRSEALFPKVTKDIFARNRSGHSCLRGSVCIHRDGAIFPCIMERRNRLGSVAEGTLAAALAGGETERIWKSSKDLNPDCRHCEFRYACSDCPPLTAAGAAWFDPAGTGPGGKAPCCLYDPHRGEWGDPEAFMEVVSRKTGTAPSGSPPERKETTHE